MNSNGIFHLTVNGATGKIRLWESPGDAMTAKDPGEVLIQFTLTRSQMALILRAEGLSREKIREKVGSGKNVNTSI